MKRFHVHLTVGKLDVAVTFYGAMFGLPPTVLKEDYAKWMLEDPRVNFAISTRSDRPGLDHLGIQAEDRTELSEISGRMQQAGAVLPQGESTCCYARSEKSWVFDPNGVPWEAFHTTGTSTVYGDEQRAGTQDGACCATPTAPGAAACCTPQDKAEAAAQPGPSCC